MSEGSAVLALGRIAHQAVLMALKLRNKDFTFTHGAAHALPVGITLYDSYHCSRYNIRTKRLNFRMFEKIFTRICRQFAMQNETLCLA